MALSARDQLRYWGIAAAILVAALWLLGDVLLPFVIGMAAAYLLDPVADRIERLGVGRGVAVGLIAAVAAVALAAAFLLVIPALVAQLVELFETLPQLARDLQAFLIDRFPSLADRASGLRVALDEIAKRLGEKGGAMLGAVLSSVRSVVTFAFVLLVAPVIAIYMLYDWDRMVERIDGLLPLDHRDTIRRLAAEIDATLASFVRGMLSVCMILGAYYAIALLLVGLKFGLAVGFIAGLLTFIPFLGAIVGGALAIGLAVFQFWGEWANIALVAAIFLVGQVAEGNVLTPRLVGRSVGLHAVWLLLALSVFGALFGFVGMLVAVPVTAALGVVIRHLTGAYLKGRLYRGSASDAQAERDGQSDRGPSGETYATPGAGRAGAGSTAAAGETRRDRDESA